MSHLGRLKRIDLRQIWESESSDFTPWLAREENLAVLADTLEIELELEAQEKPVGQFRADILCKDSWTNSWVLVENQLERTDHGHLGQLLTYASGLEAATIVWIASRFTDEHRSTLDWLNKITDDKFRFFGLEVELWQIEDSPAAPKFNIISKPNDWSRSVAQAARAIDESELTEIRKKQLAYWAGLNDQLISAKGPVDGSRKAQPRSWIAYPIGRSQFNVGGVMSRPKNQIRSELHISGPEAKIFFHLLQQQKDEIEDELGYVLTWEELPKKRDSRICAYLENVDPDDEAQWLEQHKWLAEKINQMHRVFSQRIRSLDVNDWEDSYPQ